MITLSAQSEPEVAKISKDHLRKTRKLNPEYLLYGPEQDEVEKAPLVIYLHGSGGVGRDINKIKTQTDPLWLGIQQFGETPCFLVAPQCVVPSDQGSRGGWQLKDLNAFLAYLKATLPVDEQRIYLTGNSMGGFGTWMWGGSNPEHFAAVAPLVGGLGRGSARAVTRRVNTWAANLATIPVYAFVGGKDTLVPPEQSERMVAAIRAAGGTQVNFKNDPEEGHQVRRRIYTSAEFYDWLFSHRRDP